MLETGTICSTCGRPRTGKEVEGLCEVCLLDFGLQGFDDWEAEWEPGKSPPQDRTPDRSIWRRVGGYELVGEIARGGMGVVYRARQLRLNREVALKMILVGHWASAAQVERFRLEAQRTARLDHPHIVPILELGEHEEWHYFTMKLVEGADLARQLRDGMWQSATRGDQERIATLLSQVSEAVHFAHQRGILHRDLKPTNILVDLAGLPCVTDFGLAKWIQEGSDLTRSSTVLGTPAYMAPELAAGRSREATVASDVYSLGAILYELLTRQPPYEGESSLEVLRRVSEEEIRPVRRLNSAVDTDLATICMRCLQRDPSARYGTAEELSADLKRWIRREPIQARPVPALDRLVYWLRRNPVTGTLAALLLALLIITAIGSTITAMQMKSARDHARERSLENRRQLVYLLVENGRRAVENGDPVLSLPWLVAALREDEGDPEREHAHRMRIGSVLNGLPELRGLWFHDRIIQHATFSPDGRHAATASYDGTVRIWDTESGDEVGQPRMHHREDPGLTLLFHVDFSPDGKRVVSAGNFDARIWDVATGRRLVPPLTHTNEVRVAKFSPDGQRVLTASVDWTVRCWDAGTGAPVGQPMRHGAGVLTADWSPNGRWIVSGGRDRVVRIWEADTGNLVSETEEHEAEITHVEFDSASEHVVSACGSTRVHVWRASDGVLAGSVATEARVRQARFGPEDLRIATTGSDRKARIWDWREGRIQQTLGPTVDEVVWVDWSKDGERILTGSPTRVQLWDARSGQPLTVPLPDTHTVCHSELSADGSKLLAVSLDGTARLWQMPEKIVERGSEALLFRTHGPRNSHTVVRLADGRHALWDLLKGKEVTGPLPTEIGQSSAYSFDPLSRRLAFVDHDQIRLFELEDRGQGVDSKANESATRKPLRELGSWTVTNACMVQLRPGGAHIALYGPLEAGVFDAMTGEPCTAPIRHASEVRQAMFSPDGQRLLTVSDDCTAMLWSALTGEPLSAPMQHDDIVVSGVFSPDGTLVVTTGFDGTARFWKTSTGRPTLSPLRHGQVVTSATFSPDQRWIATVAAGGQVRVWDVQSGRPVTPPLIHPQSVCFVSFVGAGDTLFCVGEDLKFQLWELPFGQPLNLQRRHVQSITDTLVPRSPSGPQAALEAVLNQSLPFEERSLAELERLSLLLTGHEVQGRGGLVPVDTRMLRTHWGH